jgi:hypothetical protein
VLLEIPVRWALWIPEKERFFSRVDARDKVVLYGEEQAKACAKTWSIKGSQNSLTYKAMPWNGEARMLAAIAGQRA